MVASRLTEFTLRRLPRFFFLIAYGRRAGNNVAFVARSDALDFVVALREDTARLKETALVISERVAAGKSRAQHNDRAQYGAERRRSSGVFRFANVSAVEIVFQGRHDCFSVEIVKMQSFCRR